MKSFCVFGLGLLALAIPSPAKTPDGKPPSEETVCDGLKGALFGLCNAYCEAMDCNSPNHHASDTACAQVLHNYMKHSDGQSPPCAATCPCPEHLPLFADLVAGDVDVQQCIIDSLSQVTSVITPEGTFALVNQSAAPPYCSSNLTQFFQVTPAEAAVCQQLLVQIATDQGVPCVAPE